MFPWYLTFLKRSLVFPILLFSSISLHCSLRKTYLSLLAILWNSAFIWVYLSFSPLPFASLLFSVICKASSDNHFAFLQFFFFGVVLITVFYTVLQTCIHSFSGTLSIRSNPLTLFVTSLYNRKGLWIVIFTISWYSFVSSPLFQKYHSKYRPSWSLNVHRVLYYKRETCLMCKIKVSKVLLTRKGLRSLCVCYRSCRYCEVKDTCEYDAQDIALTLKSGGQRLGLFYDSIRSAPFKYMKV